MVKKVRYASALVMLLSYSGPALADTTRIELGWTYGPQCSRTNWNQVYNMSVDWANQRFTAYMDIDAPNVNSVQNDLQQCAVQGAAAAGIAAIVADPAAAMPAFQGTFDSCVEQRAISYASFNISVESNCEW